MIKLNELTLMPQREMEWIGAFDAIDTSHSSIVSDNHPITYKGYRFVYIEGGYRSELAMLLPDRNFVIGGIKFSPDTFRNEVTNNNEIPAVRIINSAIHIRFRKQGLGKLMYEFLLKNNKAVRSSEMLFPGALNMWIDHMPKFTFGMTFVQLKTNRYKRYKNRQDLIKQVGSIKDNVEKFAFVHTDYVGDYFK